MASRGPSIVVAVAAGLLAAGAAAFFLVSGSNKDGTDPKKPKDDSTPKIKSTSRSIDFSMSTSTENKASEKTANCAAPSTPVTPPTTTDEAAITTEPDSNGQQNGEAQPESRIKPPQKDQAVSRSTNNEEKVADGTKQEDEKNEAETAYNDNEVKQETDKVESEAQKPSSSESAVEDEEPSTPETAGALTDDSDDGMSGDEAKGDIARLARLHAHHKKKPNHSPAKGSAAAKAIKELKASNNSKKKKKKKKNKN
mmetsp:Transcript_28273/g.77604  ORF Transcript_28273/g.77604 Transcript_28273/m.77604 type:complete len:254 (+) Transcript_28273:43-804(+)